MEYRTDLWFSPRKVLLRYAQKEEELGAEILTSSKYKYMREARSVAIMLLGLRKVQNIEYWLQIVDPKEQTPDIRTMTRRESDGWLFTVDTEVVTLGDHTDMDVDEFLKQTKLSDKKAYPPDITILCHIERMMATKKWNELQAALSILNKKNDVFLLGRTHQVDHKYQLARINPILDHVVRFDVMEEGKKPTTDTFRFKGRSTKVTTSKEEINYQPF